MNFEEYWIIIQTEKPIEENQKVLMTKSQFKNMLKNSFTKGFYQGISMIKDKSKNIDDDFFSGFFNMFNKK